MQAMGWVLNNKELHPMDKFVLLAIADNSSLYSDGCGISSISKFTNLEVNPIKSIIESLIKQRLIEYYSGEKEELYRLSRSILQELEPDTGRTSFYKKKRISSSLREKVFKRDGYKCLKCGCSNHGDLRADHIIPESKNGETSINNLQTLCVSCNSWKGVKTIDFRGNHELTI